MKYILSILFAIPAVADIMVTIPLLMSFFGFQIPTWNIPGYPALLLAGVIISVVIYFILLINIIATFIHKKHRLQKFFITLFKQHRQILIVSATLSISTFLILFVPSVFPWLITDSYDISFSAMLLIKLLVITIITGSIKYIPPQKGILALSAIALTIIAGFVIWGCIGLLQEFTPQQYNTFALNDSKAKYIINYDGDYWVTYSILKTKCHI
jgi:hypothetical protein